MHVVPQVRPIIDEGNHHPLCGSHRGSVVGLRDHACPVRSPHLAAGPLARPFPDDEPPPLRGLDWTQMLNTASFSRPTDRPALRARVRMLPSAPAGAGGRSLSIIPRQEADFVFSACGSILGFPGNIRGKHIASAVDGSDEFWMVRIDFQLAA